MGVVTRCLPLLALLLALAAYSGTDGRELVGEVFVSAELLKPDDLKELNKTDAVNAVTERCLAEQGGLAVLTGTKAQIGTCGTSLWCWRRWWCGWHWCWCWCHHWWCPWWWLHHHGYHAQATEMLQCSAKGNGVAVLDVKVLEESLLKQVEGLSEERKKSLGMLEDVEPLKG